MGLVHHDEHVVRVVEHVQLAVGGGQRLLELLDGGHHRAPAALPQGGLQVQGLGAVGRLTAAAGAAFLRLGTRAVHALRGRKAAALEGVGDLLVQLGAVGDHHDVGVGQARLAAYSGGQPQHGQGLARPLGVPDHAAPLLGPGLRQDAAHGRLDGAVLLVAGQLLDHPALLRLVDHEVAQDVQQRRRGQHPHDELRLALRLHAEPLADLVIGERSHRLPLEVGVLRRAHGGVGRGGSAVGDAEQVVVEQLGGARAVPLQPRLLVAAQLAHRLGLPYVHERRRLGLHHHQRDAVDEQRQVGLDNPLVVLGVAFLTTAPHPELGGDHELVELALGVLEVKEADVAGVLPAPGVDRQGQAEGQVLVDGLVAGHADGIDVLQLEDGPLCLLLGQPVVETQQGVPQPPLQQYLALAAALRRQRLPRCVGPSQPLQQDTGRLLGLAVLVEGGGGGQVLSPDRLVGKARLGHWNIQSKAINH